MGKTKLVDVTSYLCIETVKDSFEDWRSGLHEFAINSAFDSDEGKDLRGQWFAICWNVFDGYKKCLSLFDELC